jgi:hypothetical protein
LAFRLRAYQQTTKQIHIALTKGTVEFGEQWWPESIPL